MSIVVKVLRRTRVQFRRWESVLRSVTEHCQLSIWSWLASRGVLRDNTMAAYYPPPIVWLIAVPEHSINCPVVPVKTQWATGGGLGWFEFHYFKSCLMWHFVQILGKVALPLLRNRSSALKKGLFNF